MATLHSYGATQLQDYTCTVTQLWAAQLQGCHSYGAAQLLGCSVTGFPLTGLHRYGVAQVRSCTVTRLHRYGVAQVRGYTDMGLHSWGLHSHLRWGLHNQRLIIHNLYSMRKILWAVPDTCTALIQLCGFSVQEKLAVQLKHTGMLQACAFSFSSGVVHQCYNSGFRNKQKGKIHIFELQRPLEERLSYFYSSFIDGNCM